jgi:hypothetical protein
MSNNRFRFVSPGVDVREIDNTRRPNNDLPDIGPVVIGRARKGPGNRPVRIESGQEFVEVYGETVPGKAGGDTWRDGNVSTPMYGTYAAKAWLKNNGPVNYIRLLGDEHSSAEASGKAGWELSNTLNPDPASNGAAYGLFIIDSGSVSTALTGALAAIFYVDSGAMALSGNIRATSTLTASAGTLIESLGPDREFKAVVYDSAGNVVENTSFNFNRSSSKYIRKVFNVNPALTNSDVVSADALKNYWLGETFERHVETYVTSSAAGSQYGILLALAGSHSGEVDGGHFRYGNQSPKTGWFFSQDLSDNTESYDPDSMQKLFRFHSLYGGEWASSNIKVSIKDIKAPTNDLDQYGTFTVEVRLASDNDNVPVILERYPNCTLDPSSPNFIAAQIGDRYTVWNDIEKEWREYGIYDNISSYIRVEMNDNALAGITNPTYLPFGVYGPERHKSFAIISGSVNEIRPDETDAQTQFTASFVQGGTATPYGYDGETMFAAVDDGASTDFTGSFVFPALALRAKATDGSPSNPKKAYFGVDTGQSANSTTFDRGYGDYLRALSGDYKDAGVGEYLEYSWVFTLDDLSGSSVSTDLGAAAEYVSGSRIDGTSYTAVNGWETLLENKHNRYTAPLAGGFDGWDITELNPLRNSGIGSTATETNNYVYYTIKRAIDSIRDAEVIEHNIATMPGITNEGLTGLLVDVCEERGDSMAIIDPKGGFVPAHESTDDFATRRGDTDTVVTNMKNRSINSSYGAAYEPWVQVRDSAQRRVLFVPPSVVALGTIGSSETDTAAWFAPAGFNRGGLTEGASGLEVVNVTRKLKKDDRDDLYAVGVNSIASFPNEGIVVFGQKTLQQTASSLDRINVRRLVLLIKKTISRIAKDTLFDQNVRATWQRFKGRVSPFLENIRINFGLADFDLILDETTTTQDLIDRNTVYAKIIVRPRRAIENFAIDFVLTDDGAAFDD